MDDVLAVGLNDFTTDWEKAMGIDDRMPGLELDLSDTSNASSNSDRGFSPCAVLTPPVSCHSCFSYNFFLLHIGRSFSSNDVLRPYDEIIASHGVRYMHHVSAIFQIV